MPEDEKSAINEEFCHSAMRQVDVQFGRSIDQYRKLGLLWSTNFSQVYLVFDTKRQQRVILKFVPHANGDSQINYETHITAQLNHPYLIHTIDTFRWGEFDCLVFERITGGSLTEAVEEQRFTSLADISMVMFRCLLALHYIHQRRIIHGDISPNNILFNNDKPVVIDFGSSEIVGKGEFGQNQIGTWLFTAPERKVGRSTIAVDVYSLGATFCYLLEGNTSFHMDGGFWKGAPASLRNLIEGMMESSPAERPSVEMCLAHAFFNDMLGEKVLEAEVRAHASVN
jgi:serine/threonine protein kinase